MSLTVSVDVKQHWTMLRHWSQFIPNKIMSTDIRGHEALHHHHHPWRFKPLEVWSLGGYGAGNPNALLGEKLNSLCYSCCNLTSVWRCCLNNLHTSTISAHLSEPEGVISYTSPTNILARCVLHGGSLTLSFLLVLLSRTREEPSRGALLITIK